MAQPNFEARMSFYQHVDEMRARLMRCLWVFLLGFAVCYLVSEPIMEILRKPLFDVMPEDQRKLYFVSLFENFLTHLKISGYASLFVFSPFYFFQLWGFLKPGLLPEERKWVVPFVFAASFFFIGGALFAYFVLFPVGFKFFVSYGGPSDIPILTIDSYYGTCLRLLLLFGIAFELPVLICLLGLFGVVRAEQLRQHRSPAIIGITVIAALFAPPDAISMLILGIPLVLLYEASIVVVDWFSSRSPRLRRVSEKSEEPRHPWEGKSRP